MIFIPQPKTLNVGKGQCMIEDGAYIVLAENTTHADKTAATLVQKDMLRFGGVHLPITKGSARKGDIVFLVDESFAKEEYHLIINENGVQLTGGEQGLLRGAQTLRQAIRQKGSLLPFLQIQDTPDFEHRVYYYDVARGRVPTLDMLKKATDSCAYYKLNQLQLYVEHTYLFRDLSEVTRITDPITAEEIMTLDDYCLDRGIDLVPSIASFGHLFELLSSKSFRHLCELDEEVPRSMVRRMQHHTINIADERSFPLIKQMLDEFLPLFSSKYFNICGDETFDLGRGKGKEAMEKAGELNYYMGFVEKLCRWCEDNGKIAQFWGDVVLRDIDAMKVLPEGTICLNWRYSPTEDEEATKIVAQSGYPQMVCSGIWSWNMWMCKLDDGYNNISRMARYGQKYGAIGLLNTDWGDFGQINDPRFSLPGLIYGAAFSWNVEGTKDFEGLNRDISLLEYRDPSGTIVSLLSQIQPLSTYSWHRMVWEYESRLGLLAQEHPRPFTCETPEEAKKNNENIQELKRSIRSVASGMDVNRRAIVPAWLNALEAVEVWNEVGQAYQQKRLAPDVASKLENWFRTFTHFWRETGREGELEQVRRCVYWYADQLRG